MQPRCAHCGRILRQRIHDDLSWSWCEPGRRLPHICPGRGEAIERGEVLVRITAADWDRKEAGLRWPEPPSERFSLLGDALRYIGLSLLAVLAGAVAFGIVLGLWLLLF